MKNVRGANDELALDSTQNRLPKIEAWPSKRKAWEYYFFIDCDGHVQDRKVAKAIAHLEQECSYVKVLGSYPNAE